MVAILKLDNTSASHTYCTLKGYNLDPKEYILGMSIGDNIIKQNIFFDKNNVYSFKLSRCDIDRDIHLLLSENKDSNIVPILWNSDTVHRMKIARALSASTKKIDSTASKNSVVNASQEDTNLTNVDDNATDMESIPTSESKDSISHSDEILDKAIIESVDTMSNDDNQKADISALFEEDENVETLIDTLVDDSDNTTTNSDTPTFYNEIKDQIDELFSKYPREEKLELLIPNSKWVMIDYDEDRTKNYVVGLIYDDNNTIRYICFGVPGKMDTPPDDNLKEYSQWLPTDIKNPKDSGYWVMYQDAITGKNVVID